MKETNMFFPVMRKKYNPIFKTEEGYHQFAKYNIFKYGNACLFNTLTRWSLP